MRKWLMRKVKWKWSGRNIGQVVQVGNGRHRQTREIWHRIISISLSAESELKNVCHTWALLDTAASTCVGLINATLKSLPFTYSLFACLVCFSHKH